MLRDVAVSPRTVASVVDLIADIPLPPFALVLVCEV